MDFNKIRTLLINVMFIFAITLGEAREMNLTGSEWWSLANIELPDTNSSMNASTQHNMPSFPLPLNKRQLRLVRKHQGVIYPLVNGAKMALQECKFQFRNMRWNCPTMDDGQGGITFGNILEKGYRETAFIHAITSAAVTHSVARACAQGSVRTCTCSKAHERDPLHDRYMWGGCSDNLHFGRRFSKKFLNSLEKRRNLQSSINRHNNKVGRLYARDEMTCKCHGMTDECTFFTCWKIMRPFRRVGDSLRKSFYKASRVNPANRNGDKPERGRKIKFEPRVKMRHWKRELVYSQHSPNFCVKDDSLQLPGTVGRECNATSVGMDGCDLMCCGRGYKTENSIPRKHTCL